MKKLLSKLFDVREGEGLKSSLMFAYIFLLISSLLILKPVRQSLFLVKFGYEKLPYVYMLMALFGGLVAWLLSKHTKKVRLDVLIITTIIISILSLFIFWILLHSGYEGGWFLYAFYIWVGVFGVTAAAHFWILANHIFNAREAKRLFGLIGAGAICGGIAGGYLTNYLAPRLRTENLIFFCIGFLFICVGLIWVVWNKTGRGSQKEGYRGRRPEQAESTDNPLKLILNSRHLVYLTGIIGVSVVVANLVDYQFQAVASRTITEADRLTAFFGFWLSTFNLVSLGLQLFLTGKIMKYFGVAVSLFFLPVVLFFGAMVILVHPALWSAILIKFGDGSMKHSINRAGSELLALPIPAQIKSRAKAFIDIFIRNFAEGFGGLLIAMTIGLGFAVRHVSLFIIGLLAFWIYMILLVRQEYINSFRLAIEKRTIQIEQESLNLQDAAVFNSFLKVLEGSNERQILYVLNLLTDVENKELVPYLKKLIKHPSDEIRALVLRMAHAYDGLNMSSEAESLLDTGDQIVQTEAVRYLCQAAAEKVEKLKTFLYHDDPSLRCTAMIYASQEWKTNKEFRKEVDMKSLIVEMFKTLRKGDVEAELRECIKINIAKVLGDVDNPELYPYLYMLLNDESQAVVKEAATSAGKITSKEFMPILIKHLITREVRPFSRAALAEYGEEIIDPLISYLESPAEDIRIRLAIPKVLSLIGSQKSVSLLTNNLDQRDLFLRYEIMKALNKLRARFPLLRFDKTFIEAQVSEEMTRYNRLLSILIRENLILSAMKAGDSSPDERDEIIKARKLLSDALEEKLEEILEIIFRLLGLKYPAKDMYDAYLGVKSDRPNLRADAIEFLDNILETSLKRILIPIIETSPRKISLKYAQKLLGVPIPTEDECIDIILHGEDNWLKVCTLYLIARINYNKANTIIAKLVDDPDPTVRESARYCLHRLGYPVRLTINR